MARKNKTDEVIKEFVYDTFSHDKTVERYTDDTIKIGLWESEKEMIKKHFKVSDSILDLGCGTGRTTFGLHQMGYKNVIGVDLIPSWWKMRLRTIGHSDLIFPLKWEMQ